MSTYLFNYYKCYLYEIHYIIWFEIPLMQATWAQCHVLNKVLI